MPPLNPFPTSRRGCIYYITSALVISVALVANLRLYGAFHIDVGGEWALSDFTFVDADYPPTLIPLSRHPRNAAIVIEDTVHYALNASADWDSLFPSKQDSVRLGPQGRMFGVSMFQQLSCLNWLRRAVINPPVGDEVETRHRENCLNYIRQMLLCAASVRLEPMKGSGEELDPEKVDGLGLEHRCRDWSLLRTEFEKEVRVRRSLDGAIVGIV